MLCPIDQQPLKFTSKHGHMVHQCADCFGLFLPGNHVRAFQHNHQTTVLDELSCRPSQAVVSKCCPASQDQLSVATLDGMELDVCQACSGVWFDANELARVVRKHGLGSKNATPEGWLHALATIIPWPFGGGGSGPC